MKNTDLQTARNNLSGYTICLCKDGKCIFSEQKGISPVMTFLLQNINLSGYSVADLIVGKAVALLFVKSGIKAVYAKTLSFDGRKILEKYKIPYEYEILTEYIINRDKTDVCPMEKAVMQTENPDEAFSLLQIAFENLKNKI